MPAFIEHLARDFALLLLLSVPLILVAYRRGRKNLARNFLIAGGLVAITTAVIATSSERLIAQCLNEENTGCADPGSSGLRILLMGGYVLAALSWAYRLYQD